MTKLLDIVESENDFLRRHEIISHAAFTDRKNQALRELIAAQNGSQPAARDPGVIRTVQKLSEALKANTKLLRIHIAAVGDVSDIIIGSIRESESDGTYGRRSLRSFR